MLAPDQKLQALVTWKIEKRRQDQEIKDQEATVELDWRQMSEGK